MMTRAQRIADFFVRLAAAAPASTPGEAFALVVVTFTAVESEAAESDRMQPPSGDFYYPVDGHADLDLYRQRAHDTVIGSNGAILVRVRRTGEAVFSKAGKDGRKVEL